MTATDGILQSTIDAMQALHAGVTGVVNAPALAAYPTVIDTAACPYILTWPAAATWQQKGGAGSPRRQDRTILIVGYVQPIAQSDIPSRASEAVLLVQRIGDLWLDPANVALHNPTPVEPWQATIETGGAQPFSDEGIVSNLQFRGVPWVGFQFSVRVRLLWGMGSL